MIGGEVCPLVLHFNKGSCEEEDEYRPISNKEEEESLDPEYGYDIPTTPHTYPGTEIRPKSALKCPFIIYSNSNSQDSSQGVPPGGTFNSNSTIPQVNKTSRSDIKLPLFSGNGLEYPDQPWFLYEVV